MYFPIGLRCHNTYTHTHEPLQNVVAYGCVWRSNNNNNNMAIVGARMYLCMCGACVSVINLHDTRQRTAFNELRTSNKRYWARASTHNSANCDDGRYICSAHVYDLFILHSGTHKNDVYQRNCLASSSLFFIHSARLYVVLPRFPFESKIQFFCLQLLCRYTVYYGRASNGWTKVLLWNINNNERPKRQKPKKKGRNNRILLINAFYQPKLNKSFFFFEIDFDCIRSVTKKRYIRYVIFHILCEIHHFLLSRSVVGASECIWCA